MEEFEFRAATLKERKEFYEKEFSIKKIISWFRRSGRKLPQLCAIDAGTDTKIIKKKEWMDKLFFFPFKDLKKKIRKYIPEDVYYDRSFFENPEKVLRTLNFDDWISQELAFDIDVDNFKCDCHLRKEVCDKCVKEAYFWALKMKRELKKRFKKIDITYSGRGFHVHVLDASAYSLSKSEREELSRKMSNFPIDVWVSSGNIRLMRMPYSLHGVVSRISIPLNRDKKLNKLATIPKFLKG